MGCRKENIWRGLSGRKYLRGVHERKYREKETSLISQYVLLLCTSLERKAVRSYW